MKFFVYVDVSLEGIPYYIGKGQISRVRDLERGKKHVGISKKYGQERRILIETEDESLAFEFEKWFIEGLHTFVRDPLACHLACNFTIGGEGACGLRHTVESKLKISKAFKGKRRKSPSKETREKISLSLTGKYAKETHPNYRHVVSDETRKKQSAAKTGEKHPGYGKPGTMLGRTQSPEARKKIGDFRRNKPRSEETKRKVSEGLRKYWALKKADAL